MKRDNASRIPIPARVLWREARLRMLPPVVCLLALGAILFLWRAHVAPPTLVGQAEPTLASVSAPKGGTLVELSVSRFQHVQAGEPIGRIRVAEPALASSTLDVIRAEIDRLRAEMKPMIARQRNAMDYTQLRLDWMRQRAQLATARASLQFAESEFSRTAQLFEARIASQSTLDEARTSRDGARQAVEELSRLVTECEHSLDALDPTNSTDFATAQDDPLRAAIAVQEAKLHLAEMELSPIVLRAPMDGVIKTIWHQPGESVSAGQPIVVVATPTSSRIIGYLRSPLIGDPHVGMTVKVSTRGMHRATGTARVAEVGSQLESIPALLQGSLKFASAELGLPLDISVPEDLQLRPGELVDITLLSEQD